MRRLMMRRLSIGVLALVATASAASAADMPVRAAPPPPPIWTWTGCYMGLNAGYGWGRQAAGNVNEVSAANVTFNFADFNYDSKGALGGGQFGCNWQVGQGVLGFETDIQAADVKGDVQFPGGIFNIPRPAFNTEVSSKLTYFGTVRGRLGFSFVPGAMLYLTGGFAYGEVSSTLSFPFAAAGANSFIDFARRVQYGYAAGAGGEFMLTPRLSVKAEYLYVDLGSATHSFNIAGDSYGFGLATRMHTARLGLNFLWPVVGY
jgi:outer membrane immunogenic protein